MDLFRGCVTLQTCSDLVCVSHLSLCVNILLGNSPSISSVTSTLSPLCLPTGHTVDRFDSDKSAVYPGKTLHPTWLPEVLIRQTFQQQARQPLERGTHLWLAPAFAVCSVRERFSGPGFVSASQEDTCADGSWTKGWHLSCWGPFQSSQQVKHPAAFQHSSYWFTHYLHLKHAHQCKNCIQMVLIKLLKL